MKKSKKNLVIGILCVALVFMGVGYSLLQSSLNISGTAKSSGSFDVQIVDVDVNSKSNGSTNGSNTTYSGQTATLEASFNAPGDYITYDVTVQNLGTIDALITATTYPQNDKSNYVNMTCNMKNRTELDAGDQTVFQCTMIYDENRQVTAQTIPNGTISLQIQLTAVQKSGYQIAYVDQEPENSCFISAIPGEINYYDTSKSGCGTSVSIPNDLRLKVSPITNISFNNQLCMDLVNNQTECDGYRLDIENMSTQELFNSELSILAMITYGTPTGDFVPITKIGASSFANSGLVSITLPDSIIEIKAAAFNSCNLQSITLPNYLQKIGKGAFDDNRLTGTLTIPATVTEIGYAAFASSISNPTNMISGVSFEKGSQLQIIGGEAFKANPIVGELTLPDSVTTVGENAFSNTRINILNLGSSLTSIGDYAFLAHEYQNEYSTTLLRININMTQALWNSRGLSQNPLWFSDVNNGIPTIVYKQQ